MKSKCIKQVGFRKTLTEAKSICQNYGAKIYVPKSIKELKELPYSLLKLDKTKHWIWIGLTLRNTYDKSFPPTVTDILGYATESWLSSNDVADIWRETQKNIPKRGFFKTPRRQRWQYIRMKNAYWSISGNVTKTPYKNKFDSILSINQYILKSTLFFNLVMDIF